VTRCTVIAEAGVNHDGMLDAALRLVDVAADAGADIVKFQTFKADRLVTRAAPKADYQKQTTDAAETQHAMLHRLELDERMHEALARRCDDRGIEFLSTPFDVESLRYLCETIGIKRVKIPSGEITNGPLLLAAARTGLPIILSTGMSTLNDIADAVRVIGFGCLNATGRPGEADLAATIETAAARDMLRLRLTLLHCTTEYPAPFEDTHLRALDTLRARFSVPVGLSDHTRGIVVPLAAVAREAVVIEKHFTLDRSRPGPDHAASLEPGELIELVRNIRIVETALGAPEKTLSAAEQRNRQIARKSLVALVPISAGERFTPENLGAKRPGSGRSPMDYWRLLDTVASRDFAPDEPIP
jgi:N-acetylneuraminate synthase